jgi:hypothetical protein
MQERRTDRSNWFVRKYSSHEEADRHEAEYWKTLTPQQRLDAVWECVCDYLSLRNEPEPRFRRVYRVLERTPG